MSAQKSLKNVVFWNAISQFGYSGVSFLATIILARFLSPEDFGVIGIVTIFIGFSEIFIDGQMGGALLRKPSVNRTDYTTLFWYNLAASSILYLILFLIAPLIADFYNNAELIVVIRVLALTVIIFALRVTQRVMIFRNMQFKIMAIINVGSGLISLAIATYFAWNGAGYWSLVIMQLATAIIGLIFMEVYNGFWPRPFFSLESFKYQFGFGINLLGSEMLKTIVNNITTNIIAKVSTLGFTGLYTQSSRITNFIAGSASGILDQSVFPYMSKLGDKDKVRRVYIKLVSYCTIIVTLIIALFYFLAPTIINLILGTQWIDAVPIFRILSFGLLPLIIQTLARNVLKTLGLTRIILNIELYKSLLLLLALAISVAVSQYAIVWALVVVQYLSCIIWCSYTRIAFAKGYYKN